MSVTEKVDRWIREDVARIEMMEQLAAFSGRVANGEATSEEIAFMTEVAKTVDQSKENRLRGIVSQATADLSRPH